MDVQNAGLLSVTAGTVTLGDVTSPGDDLTGTTTVGRGATLFVSSLWQESIIVSGTLVLG